MHTNAQVRLKTASRQVGRQASFQHDSSWLLAGCSGAVRLVPDQRLLRQSCIRRRRACNVIWITGRVQRIVVRLGEVGLKWAHWWRRGRVVLLAVSSGIGVEGGWVVYMIYMCM